MLNKPSSRCPIYKEVVCKEQLEWYCVGCFEGKAKDYWPAENEAIQVLQDLWFDRVGTNRMPIRIIVKAAVVPTMQLVDKGRVWPK